MFCIVGLIIFGILGIFSASHRELAKEAAKCVFRRVTFRACNTTFQDKAKGKILGWLLKKSPLSAKIFNKYSEVLSWIFIILMIGSTIWVIKDIYNYYAYGSCNGLNSNSFCVFDPSGKNNQTTSLDGGCRAQAPKESNLKLAPLDLSLYPEKNQGAANQIVFIGCYTCDYTRKAYPTIQNLVKNKSVDFIFVHFPIKAELEYITPYIYAAYRQNHEKFWQLNDMLIASEKNVLEDKEYVLNLIKNLGFDLEKIKLLAEDEKMQNEILDSYEQIKQTGIYGTPTIFINGKAYVGPKPERVYDRALNK
ncbi:MAG: thioredoxin domain-containing protein [Patescibacteria group bacterium]